MVPKLTAGGQSFEGAAAYYLADKAQPGHARPVTSARVAWTATRNLATGDPREACRIMAATAHCHLVLKTAAGVKTTGRKLKKPVLAYSLSWHPSERPTREEQMAAAEESLQALGLAAHQAVIVCHIDEPHPHVHVIVNRVDPCTGRAAKLSKSKLTLSRWAQAYEERRGHVLCVERVENNARRAGTRPGRATDNRSRTISRAEYAAGGPSRPGTAALRHHHAVLFSAERGSQHQVARARADEATAFHAGRKASRRAVADRLAAPPLTPDQAETHVRLSALLASGHLADALAALTRDRSTFTRRDLERFVGRHTPDAAAFTRALAALDASGALIRVGRDVRGRDRFTTQAHQAIERRMFELAVRLHRACAATGPVPARFKGWSLSADQMAALLHVLAAPRIAAVEGVAGSGKSTMLHAARQSWEAAGFRVQGMALSAEAAEGLKNGSGIASGTIHSRLYQWEQGRNLPGPKDVIVVDEAGLAGSRLMERLLHFAEAGGAKIVLVGGARQLQAIEAGGAFRAITDRIGAAFLKTVRRQKADWQKEATAELATGKTAAALARYEAAGMVHAHETDAAAMAALVEAWDRARIEQPGQSQLIMAFRRRDVRELNALARARLRQAGTIEADVTLDTAEGRQAFAVNDRLYFLRNDPRLEVRNGSLGTVEALHGRKLTVRLDGDAGRRVTFSLDEYGHIAHGYAATIHKSQGATVDRAHLYCSPNLDQHAAYVAMTRHRDRFDMHWSRESIPTRARLAAILSRLAMKDTSFDYADDRAADDQARRDAGDEMRARIVARAKTFADRETTPAGRMANARALLPAGSTPLQVVRLAMNAVERAHLFRLRQGRLRQWARKTMPAPASSTLAQPARPALPVRRAALLDHARATLQQMQAMEARHDAERRSEREVRAALQRQAAQNWQAEGIKAQAEVTFARYAGFGVAHWQAAQTARANDNDNHRRPMLSAPRPR